MRLLHLLLPLYRVQRVPVLMIRVRHSECIDRYPTDPIDALVGHARRRCRNEVFVVYGTFSAIGRHETMRHIGYSVFELVGKKLTKGRCWLQQKNNTVGDPARCHIHLRMVVRMHHLDAHVRSERGVSRMRLYSVWWLELRHGPCSRHSICWCVCWCPSRPTP